jgi:hypothetical protein
MTVPTSGEPLPIAQEGAAMAFVGAGLLGTGFVFQLLGYVVSSGAWWLIGIAGLAVVVTYAAGRRVARRIVTPWRHRQAETEFEEARARKYAQPS